MYSWYNEMLRNIHTALEKVRGDLTHIVEWKQKATEGDKVPFATTTHVINSSVIKLSRVQKAEKVFRGTKGGRLPGKFWKPNSDNIRGGIERAFMSTTTNRAVAMDFASEVEEGQAKVTKPSIVFEIQMGMVDRGAAVQCFSQFPAEAEVGKPCIISSIISSYLQLCVDECLLFMVLLFLACAIASITRLSL
jgi:hypothetical protein